ncbi:hypothetical protein ACFL9T_09230 [Thermodesulfobacteriota bacterium]
MYFDIEKIINNRLVVGYGTGELLDRAMHHEILDFEYFVDDRAAGGKKYGRDVFSLDKLREESRDVVIFIFERYIPRAVSFLNTLGFTWLKDVFDCRFFGVTSRYFDHFEVLRDLDDVQRSGLMNVYTGKDCEIHIQGITVAWNEASPIKINLYLGNQAKVRLEDVVLEEGVKIYAGSNATFLVGAGSTIQTRSYLSAAVSSRIEIGDKVLISPDTVIDAANHVGITIDSGCTFGANLNLWAYAPIKIGPECMFSENVYVESGAGHDIIIDGKKRYPQAMTIGRKVWVGWGGSLLCGSSIGDESMVGALSLVNRPFGSHQLIAGNPARVVNEGICWQRDYTAYKEVYHGKSENKSLFRK